MAGALQTNLSHYRAGSVECTMVDVTMPNVPATIADLTLAEKAALTSGAKFWYTKPIERQGIPSVMLTDGPHGLRKQRAQGDHLGIARERTCDVFPTGSGLGSSWDAELVERIGEALGREASTETSPFCSARGSTSSARRCVDATSSICPKIRSSRAFSARPWSTESRRRVSAPR